MMGLEFGDFCIVFGRVRYPLTILIPMSTLASSGAALYGYSCESNSLFERVG